MTRMLTSDTDAELAELELAEAQAAAAEAEAAAARARADVARARAKAAQGKKRASDADPDESGQRESEQGSAGTVSLGEDGDGDEDGAAAQMEPVEPRPGRWHRLRQAPRRPSKRGVALVVMVAITLAAAAGAVTIGLQHHEAGERQDRATQFTDVAKLGVVAVTSLDYRNAERDVKRIVDLSTGAFAKDFTDRSKDFTSVIKKSQVTTKGKVSAAAVESVNGDTATVLVAATSEVTNAAGAKEEPRTWRLRVTVTDADGTMKISKVDFVP